MADARRIEKSEIPLDPKGPLPTERSQEQPAPEGVASIGGDVATSIANEAVVYCPLGETFVGKVVTEFLWLRMSRGFWSFGFYRTLRLNTKKISSIIKPVAGFSWKKGTVTLTNGTVYKGKLLRHLNIKTAEGEEITVRMKNIRRIEVKAKGENVNG